MTSTLAAERPSQYSFRKSCFSYQAQLQKIKGNTEQQNRDRAMALHHDPKIINRGPPEEEEY